MTDIIKYEPLWDTWYVDSFLGKGCYGEVYKIRREAFDRTHYSALKRIPIPYDEDELRQMRSEMGDIALSSFLQGLLRDLIGEINMMNELRGNSNIVSFEDYKIVKKIDRVGWDMFIRMELLESLSNRLIQAPLSRSETLKMGMHMCRALELCAMKNIIHRDIKPENIFISQYGEYKLGDFGIARQMERIAAGISLKGTYTYMAPEVFRGEDYGASVDTYSLGIVLYRFLNKNQLPFLPDSPQQIMPRDLANALQRRLRGERLPDLKGVSPELNALVLKACAYNWQERFKSPTEMRHALENVTKRTYLHEHRKNPVPERTKTLTKIKLKSSQLIAILAACGVVAVVTAAIVFSLWGKDGSRPNNPNSLTGGIENIVVADDSDIYGSITINDYYGSITISGGNGSGEQSKKDITNAGLAGMVTNGELPADLTWLKLDDNIISDLTPLQSLTELIHLDLTENGVGDVFSLSSLTALQALYLSDNPIRDLTPLQSLQSLRVLRVSRTKVTNLAPLTALPKLRSLSIDGAAVSDYTPLKSMNLRHLTVSDASDIMVLKTLTTLKRLSIYRSKLSSEQVSELKAALPNCEINIYK